MGHGWGMVGAQGMVGARLGHSWGMVGAQGMLGARLGHDRSMDSLIVIGIIS